MLLLSLGLKSNLPSNIANAVPLIIPIKTRTLRYVQNVRGTSYSTTLSRLEHKLARGTVAMQDALQSSRRRTESINRLFSGFNRGTDTDNSSVAFCNKN